MYTFTRIATLIVYGLFGVLFVAAGAAIVLYESGALPTSWNAAILAEAEGNLNTLHVVQELGSLLVFAGLISLWFVRKYEQSQIFHWSLTVFWALLALVHWFDVRGPNPSVMGPLITTIPFIVLVVLGLMRFASDHVSSANRGAQVWTV